MEAQLEAARATGLQAFEESLTFWAPDGSGRVLTWAELQREQRAEALPHPKVCVCVCVCVGVVGVVGVVLGTRVGFISYDHVVQCETTGAAEAAGGGERAVEGKGRAAEAVVGGRQFEIDR